MQTQSAFAVGASANDTAAIRTPVTAENATFLRIIPNLLAAEAGSKVERTLSTMPN
jgi:hypothetical protein